MGGPVGLELNGKSIPEAPKLPKGERWKEHRDLSSKLTPTGAGRQHRNTKKWSLHPLRVRDPRKLLSPLPPWLCSKTSSAEVAEVWAERFEQSRIETGPDLPSEERKARLTMLCGFILSLSLSTVSLSLSRHPLFSASSCVSTAQGSTFRISQNQVKA